MEKKNGFKMVFLAGLALIIVSGCATTGSHWQGAGRLGTIEAYETFLRQHPNSEYSLQARSRLAALYEEKEWNRGKQQNTIAAYESFLARYPKGAFTSMANTKLETLYYDNARAKDDLNKYADFLRRYPNSTFKNSILQRVEALLFQSAKSIYTVLALEDFLRKFPDGVYASEARVLIGKINEAVAKEKERFAQAVAEKRERFAREAKEEQEKIAREWEKSQAQNTVSGYKEFLDRNPKSEFAAKARQYLTVQKVEGWVKKVDARARNVTIKTTMGQQEILSFDSEVKLSKRGAPLSLRDMKDGESVMIEYNSLPGKAISKSILVGESVSHCSCGSSCSCPLSRGCRVIRY